MLATETETYGKCSYSEMKVVVSIKYCVPSRSKSLDKSSL